MTEEAQVCVRVGDAGFTQHVFAPFVGGFRTLVELGHRCQIFLQSTAIWQSVQASSV
jgi:hypothetical protein